MPSKLAAASMSLTHCSILSNSVAGNDSTSEITTPPEVSTNIWQPTVDVGKSSVLMIPNELLDPSMRKIVNGGAKRGQAAA